jgi:hypothetical protein
LRNGRIGDLRQRRPAQALLVALEELRRRPLLGALGLALGEGLGVIEQAHEQ